MAAANKQGEDILTDLEKSGSGHASSPLSKSMDFINETKYVMLNFMSLVPPEMYAGHIVSSPDIAASRLSNKLGPISKSKSFDIGSKVMHKHSKYLHRLQRPEQDSVSPSSEDNASYRYKQYITKFGKAAGDFALADTNSLLLGIEHLDRYDIAEGTGSFSPRKLCSPQRQISDISSTGDSSSYMSDADDERDNCSSACSNFSGWNINYRDGFLDLCKSASRMPAISSVSEMECIDQIENWDEADAIEHVYVESADRDVNGDHQDAPDAGISNADGPRKLADRSKLKLNIQNEQFQLDEVLISLQTELNSEMEELESEYEVTRFPGDSTVQTPQTHAAHVLARIGDEIKEQYSAQIAAAVHQLTYYQIENLTYSQFRQIAKSVIVSSLPGWRQVALFMVFGQKVIWGAVKQGHQQVGNIIDHLTQLVADEAADFIVRAGGWGSVMNIDPSQSSDDGSLDIAECFNQHNVAKVDSVQVELKTLNDGGDAKSSDSSMENSGEVGKGIDCRSGNKVVQEINNVKCNQAGQQVCDTKQIFSDAVTGHHFDSNGNCSNVSHIRYQSSIGFDCLPGSQMEDEAVNLYYENGDYVEEDINNGVFQSLDQTDDRKHEEVYAQSGRKTDVRGTSFGSVWEMLAQIRKMGSWVFAVTLTALGLGVGFRLAVRNRK